MSEPLVPVPQRDNIHTCLHEECESCQTEYSRERLVQERLDKQTVVDAAERSQLEAHFRRLKLAFEPDGRKWVYGGAKQ